MNKILPFNFLCGKICQMIPYISPISQLLIFFIYNIKASLKYIHNNTVDKSVYQCLEGISRMNHFFFFPPSCPPFLLPFISFLPSFLLSFPPSFLSSFLPSILLSFLLFCKPPPFRQIKTKRYSVKNWVGQF